MVGEWQHQLDGLQQQIGTLNRSLANHAHAIARLENATQQGILPSIVKRIEDLAASTDRRFIEGGERVNQRLERLQAEIRAFATQFRVAPKSPDPPPGMRAESAPAHFDLTSPGNHVTETVDTGNAAANSGGAFNFPENPFRLARD